jgi:glycosyltransferase involved in cell wall biosynthesis
MLEDIDLELNGADLLIHPSVEEPFGVAVLEGMRAGLPIVASRVGGIPEVVKEGTNAALFEPESAQALVSAVIAVMQSAERMREMAAASTERWREHFGYDRMLDRVENYFQEILHDGRN